MSNNDKRVTFFDTTLRDGGQTEGVVFTAEVKARIARVYDQFGLSYVEGGWPGANKVDTDYFNNLPLLKKAKHVAFCMTRHAKKAVEEDKAFCRVVNSDVATVCVFGKTWDLHVEKSLKTTLDNNLAMIFDSVAFVKSRGKEMIFDAEHFFDGYKANPDYALKCLKAAHKAGADWLVLCDTNGHATPREVYKIVKAVHAALPDAKLGIHAHDDGKNAAENSVQAVEAGCRMVQGTFNGLGERCGNADLTNVLPTLKFKYGYDVGITDTMMRNLKRVSDWIYKMTKKRPQPNQPWVGDYAFLHKGGVHAQFADGYEIFNPAWVGNKRRVIVSDQAGLSSLKIKMRELGIDTTGKRQELKQLRDKVQEKCGKGYTYSEADASLAVLAARFLTPEYEMPFELVSYHYLGDGKQSKDNGQDKSCEALVKLVIDGEQVIGSGKSKKGNVDALALALYDALVQRYPDLKPLELERYDPTTINMEASTGADMHVLTRMSDKESGLTMNTVGVSDDILGASLVGMMDAYKYIMLAKSKAFKNVSLEVKRPTTAKGKPTAQSTLLALMA